MNNCKGSHFLGNSMGEIIPRVWARVRVRVGLRVEDRVRLRVRGRVGFRVKDRVRLRS